MVDITMASTLEHTNVNILKRIGALETIVRIYQEYELEPAHETRLEHATSEVKKIKDSYELGSVTYISKYVESKDDKTTHQKYYNDYMEFIVAENISGRLNRVHKILHKLYKEYDINQQELVLSFKTYEKSHVNPYCNKKHKQVCMCGNDFSIDSKTSECVCKKCGITIKLFGVVFEDKQFYFQEGHRAKHGRYDPTKHCQFWVERIMGREGKEISPKFIEDIKKRIANDRIRIENLTCPMIRKYLKRMKKTGYNDHVPLILKTITGKELSQLTDAELRLVYSYFSRVIPVYNLIKPPDKTNCPYHPFFIYKIIEQIIKKPSDRVRKKDILGRIHLQSRETLIEKDNIWKDICEYFPEFKYCPTSKA